jgi:hypothetical protein
MPTEDRKMYTPEKIKKRAIARYLSKLKKIISYYVMPKPHYFFSGLYRKGYLQCFLK